MTNSKFYDAIIVGAGPNGLAAAITLAQAGKSVLVMEASEKIGGGARTSELTLPGYLHDVCSAIHPLGIGSSFFKSLPLAEYGLEWIQPTLPLAHPFDDGTAAVLDRSTRVTGESLGQDSRAYQSLMDPMVNDWEQILDDLLGPLPLPPKHLLASARFGLPALLPARWLAERLFKGPRARGLFAGIAGHSILPLEKLGTAGFGLFLGFLGHAVGWPVPRRGSQSIMNAMAGYLQTLGGEIVTGRRVCSLEELPPAQAVLFDVTPRQLIEIAGGRLPSGYRRQLARFRYGPGAFKVDYALSEPVPWTAPECRLAGTVHLGGTLDEIAVGEAAVWRGEHPEKPLILIAQQSLFDPTRAPDGKHTLWAYCHVPHGSTVDMTARIEAQIDRFAPGFRDCILERSVKNTHDIQAYNSNYIGGDIIGGVQDLGQFFTRPTLSLNPYATPVKSLYLCSSSTPPGGGVHGMCGYHSARACLERSF